MDDQTDQQASDNFQPTNMDITPPPSMEPQPENSDLPSADSLKDMQHSVELGLVIGPEQSAEPSADSTDPTTTSNEAFQEIEEVPDLSQAASPSNVEPVENAAPAVAAAPIFVTTDPVMDPSAANGKKSFSLAKSWLGLFLGIPLLMSILVLATAFKSGAFASPSYDFLYYSCESSCGRTEGFSISNGKISEKRSSSSSSILNNLQLDYLQDLYDSESEFQSENLEESEDTSGFTNITHSESDLIRPPTTFSQEKPKLYFHDVSENKSTEISVEDANKLTIEEGRESPDGFSLLRNTGPSAPQNILFTSLLNVPTGFTGGEDPGYILTNGKKQHNVALELAGKTSSFSYYVDLEVLGWVK